MFGKKKNAPEITEEIQGLMDGGAKINIVTSQGNMTAVMFPDIAPKHVANFFRLAKDGFWEGCLFHRTIPGFMIQGGCPHSKDPDNRSMHGTGNAGYNLDAEFSDRPHTRGILSMARTGDPNSASCQFFVMHRDSPHLDGQYSVFGEVVEGLDILDLIAQAPKGSGDYPNEPVKIERMEILNP